MFFSFWLTSLYMTESMSIHVSTKCILFHSNTVLSGCLNVFFKNVQLIPPLKFKWVDKCWTPFMTATSKAYLLNFQSGPFLCDDTFLKWLILSQCVTEPYVWLFIIKISTEYITLFTKTWELAEEVNSWKGSKTR